MKLNLKMTTAKLYVAYADGTNDLKDIEYVGKITNKEIERRYYEDNDSAEKPIKEVKLIVKSYSNKVYRVTNITAFQKAISEFATPETEKPETEKDSESKGE